jgi:hypothetical protein
MDRLTLTKTTTLVDWGAGIYKQQQINKQYFNSQYCSHASSFLTTTMTPLPSPHPIYSTSFYFFICTCPLDTCRLQLQVVKGIILNYLLNFLLLFLFLAIHVSRDWHLECWDLGDLVWVLWTWMVLSSQAQKRASSATMSVASGFFPSDKKAEFIWTT